MRTDPPLHRHAPGRGNSRDRCPKSAVAHLVRVLRLGIGDGFALFNGDGCDYSARALSRSERRPRKRELLAATAIANESPLRITLVQGIARGEKMDLILQKATELGVARIAPVVTERTEVKLDGERVEQKHAALARSAGFGLRTVRTGAAAANPGAAVAWLASPLATPVTAASCWTRDAGQTLAGVALGNQESVSLLIGPEGGLSERDLAAAARGALRRLATGPAHPAHRNRRTGGDRGAERALRRLALSVAARGRACGEFQAASLSALSISNSRLIRSGTAAASSLSITIEWMPTGSSLMPCDSASAALDTVTRRGNPCDSMAK